MGHRRGGRAGGPRVGRGVALTSHLTVFAVDDSSVQVTWRGLEPGLLGLRVLDTEVEAVAIVGDGSPAGGIVLAGLPAGATLTLEANLPGSGGRGPRERLAFRTLDRLPGEELFRLATVGDLHLGATAFGQRGTIVERPTPDVAHPRRCTQAALDDAVNWGARHLVAKGDVTNYGQVHEWRAWAEMSANLDIPVDVIPGNHDRAHRSGGRSLLPDDAARAFGLSVALPLIIRDLPGLRLVLVDSTTAGRNEGTLTGVADDLVDAVRDADPNGAVLVALHHQLHPRTGAEVWPRGIVHEQSRTLLEHLGAVHRHVLVTSGHTHRHRRWTHAGVTTTQVGSTKDYPGVWAGYVVAEGGLRQVVRRVTEPSCIAWTDRTRRAAGGAWRFIAPGLLSSRCFDLTW